MASLQMSVAYALIRFLHFREPPCLAYLLAALKTEMYADRETHTY